MLRNSPSFEEVQLLRRAQEENVIDENNAWDTAEVSDVDLKPLSIKKPIAKSMKKGQKGPKMQ